MDNAEKTLYELTNVGETVKVRPCRICGSVPEFYWFDACTENCYHLGCRKCGIFNIQAWRYDKLVENWNDMKSTIEEWKEKVDI